VSGRLNVKLKRFCCVVRLGTPPEPGKPLVEISGKFAVVKWKRPKTLAGDQPVLKYIVQAQELARSMSFCRDFSTSGFFL